VSNAPPARSGSLIARVEPLPRARLAIPIITVYNRQRAVQVDLPWLRRFADRALRLAAQRIKPRRHAVMSHLDEVEVTLVSDRTMAKLHTDFMNLPGPTDVLTFSHGEIVISAETAAANARRYRKSVAHEIALYTVHGLLHLNGFEDATASGAAEMRAAQTRILHTTLAQLASSP
jgi:probable rRNA maturation factor